MLSAAWRHAEAEHCSRGEVSRQSGLYAAFGGRSPHKTQSHRNLAGGSIAPAEHQRPENTSEALGLEGKQAYTTAER
jgi:hypothetical protein